MKVNHLHKDFWVIAVYNNPLRFKRRRKLFGEFITRMKNYGVNLCVVELAYGERTFETQELDVQLKVQLRTDTVLWHKENLVNIGISRLPNDWKYVAWIDTDIDFVNPFWAEETIQQLQMHPVVQMFEDAIDLGPTNEVMNVAKCFAYCYKNDIPKKTWTTTTKNKQGNYYFYSQKSKNGVYWHPGYAWAATRHAIETFGGLFEVGILGSGDHHMAMGLIGKADESYAQDVSEDYKSHVLNWQTRALRLHKDIGYVNGTIYHYWHGKKSDRKYNDRWRHLVDNNYQPTHDIHRDWQGLLVFYEGHAKLRDDIVKYFRERNEDSIDL
jgi:hypothetical protein